MSSLFRGGLALIVFLSTSVLQAQTTTVNFEGLPDGSVTQLSGLQFSNTSVVTAGFSLNELDFPPHSGVKAAFDSGGPITVVFPSPVAVFEAYFNYRTSLTVQAYDASSNLLTTTTSHYSSNLAISGIGGSTPNEFLQVFGTNIARVVITGDPNGASFSMDDVSSGTPLPYRIGDAYPYTGFGIGQFGDGSLNTLDLLTALRAITQLPGYVPATCSDRFDAMDAFPVDTVTQRGGDGSLNSLDLIETLRRATNLDTTRPTRASRGLSCSTASAESAARSVQSAGVLIVGTGGAAQNGQRPVYLMADETLSLVGFSLGLGIGQAKVSFTPAPQLTPSLTDTAVTGTLAAAWLEGLNLPARQQVLLGYVTASDDPASIFPVIIFTASGNTTDGRTWSFQMQEGRPR